MGKPLVQVLAETSGDCCVWYFLQRPEYKGMTNEQLAARLGIGRTAIVNARSMLKDGGYDCRHRKECKKPG